MINKNKMIRVTNKFNGTTGYHIPDLMIHRNFYPGETKEIEFQELEKLSYLPGGKKILMDYLEIKDKQAINKLFGIEPEPEYYYTREDIKTLMTTGTLDQFLDCLDFAPEAVKEMIKDIAVELPLNDVVKRNAIQEKLNFDVNKAIEIKNTKFDSGEEDNAGGYGRLNGRRTTPVTSDTQAAAPSGRRYKPVSKDE